MATKLVQLEVKINEDGTRSWIECFDTRNDVDDTALIASIEVHPWIDGTAAISEFTMGRVARALFPSDAFHLQLWDEESSQWLDYDEWMGYR